MTTSSTPRVTLDRIAREGSVSAATVSKVLNNRPGVAAHTRARVAELLERSGYIKRGTATASNSRIELVFEQIDEAWVIEVIRGVVSAASSRGLGVTISETKGRDLGTMWMDEVVAREPAGLILVAPHLSRSNEYKLQSRVIPYVMIDPDGDPPADVASVGSANFSGGLAAGRHLLELGHRRIGVVGHQDTRTSTLARIAGLRSAMSSAGIILDESLIEPPDAVDVPKRLAPELAQAMALLDRSDPVSAIFATSDVHALGVYEVARLLEIRIPQDLSVVGYDDLQFARWAGPPLTTIRQPLDEMGREAAELVMRLRVDPSERNRRLDLATTLVVRGSTAPPRDAT